MADRPRPVVGDCLYHLVQDDELVSRIHSEELPPDAYYAALSGKLQELFPKADPSLVDHAAALASAFDTAGSFALSFGIAKFQLAQPEVKLVGEYVGREGRRPNDEVIKALTE